MSNKRDEDEDDRDERSDDGGDEEGSKVSTKGKKDLKEFSCQYCGAVNHVPRELKRPEGHDPVEPVKAVCGTCGTPEGERFPPGHPNARKPGETADGRAESPWTQDPPPAGSVADPNANAEPEEVDEEVEAGTKPAPKPGRPGAPKPSPMPAPAPKPGAPGAPAPKPGGDR